jgi:hypothetical protein
MASSLTFENNVHLSFLAFGVKTEEPTYLTLDAATLLHTTSSAFLRVLPFMRVTWQTFFSFLPSVSRRRGHIPSLLLLLLSADIS